MQVVCLHTHPDNIRVFEDACPPDLKLVHHVRSDFVRRINTGGDDGLKAELNQQMTRLGRNAEAVLVTCSALRTIIPQNCFSADAILALQLEQLDTDTHLEIFYTNPGSEGPTTELFSQLKEKAQSKITLIEGAWGRFLAGERNEYLMQIADAATKSSADVVAFAQSSMAPAVPLCNREIWNVPSVALPWLANHLHIKASE